MSIDESKINRRHVMSVMKKMALVSKKREQKNQDSQFTMASSKCHRDKNGILHIDEKVNTERKLIKETLDELKHKVIFSNYQFTKEQLIDYLTYSAKECETYVPGAKIQIENYDERNNSATHWPIVMRLVDKNGKQLHQLHITPFSVSRSARNSKFTYDATAISKIANYCCETYGDTYRKDYCRAAIIRAKRAVIYGFSSLASAAANLGRELVVVNLCSRDNTQLVTMPLDDFKYEYHVVDRKVLKAENTNTNFTICDYTHMQAVKRRVDRLPTKEIFGTQKHYFYDENGILHIEDENLQPQTVEFMMQKAGELNDDSDPRPKLTIDNFLDEETDEEEGEEENSK